MSAIHSFAAVIADAEMVYTFLELDVHSRDSIWLTVSLSYVFFPVRRGLSHFDFVCAFWRYNTYTSNAGCRPAARSARSKKLFERLFESYLMLFSYDMLGLAWLQLGNWKEY